MATAEATLSPQATRRRGGFWDWITTVDHKKIGILYGGTALLFLLIGGVEALLIRTQLMGPDGKILNARLYDELFTMHGTTMVFLVGMPIAVALFNYVIPLQIGARDVAFPRLNALSYWVFLAGALFMNSSWFFGAAPNGGWFGYTPLTGPQYSPGLNIDFWVLGLQILGVASIMGGVNFITTIINLRAPGMKLMRMPLFTWMGFVTSFLLVTALPVLAVALFFQVFDRFWGTNFYITAAGGDAFLWQHLFWIFGHPEVYILILPAFGVMSDVIPTFSRKPLFGYSLVVYSGILIGFIGWGVWAHHMFATGLGPVADSFFTVSTMIIAIPTGVKIFNWLATMWGGRLQFTTAMKFCLGLLALFTIGGISGIWLGSPPIDLQETDTYFVVAHFHYVLVGGLIMGVFAAFYYWFPKMTGRLMSEKLGSWHFWMFLFGMNLTFFPMHLAGLLGMPRRVYTYHAGLGLSGINFVETIGAYIQALAVLIFVYNIIRSWRHGKEAGENPWGAHTLEWATSSPPPQYNFAELPEVHSREPMWDEPEQMIAAATRRLATPPAMPSGSYWPILTAMAIATTFILFLTHIWWMPLIGVALTALMVINFAFEPTFH